MIHANELQEDQAQIQLALAAVEVLKIPPKPSAKNRPQVVVLHAGATRQLNLSGAQVLAAALLSLCMASVFTWVLVRHWLFAP
jgi:hypothetical protein